MDGFRRVSIIVRLDVNESVGANEIQDIAREIEATISDEYCDGAGIFIDDVAVDDG